MRQAEPSSQCPLIDRERTEGSSNVLEKFFLGTIMPCDVAVNELQININNMDQRAA
jgi:hypothetical protein